MEHMKRKLLMAGLSLTVSVVMMVTASLAWMTLSTAPEISGIQVSLYTDQTLLSSIDGENFGQYTVISDKFANLAPLLPTSTADGVNWFIPAYQDVLKGKVEGVDDGWLLGVDQFTLANENDHANVSKTEGDGNYYVYADFWLKTEEPACDVRLSIPSNIWGGENGQLVGTYVLAGEEQMTIGGEAAKEMSRRQTESCVRVGLMIDPGEKVEDGGTAFYIYEPNADQRSINGDRTPDHVYVHGYTFNTTTYQQDAYIKTQPIGLGENGKGTVTSIDPQTLIIQKKSVWGSGANADFARQTTPGSDDVDTFGKFISAADLYANNPSTVTVENLPTGTGASQVLLRLTQDQPVKVRLFIWLEGQDVDCWNEVAAGSFVVNLELAGETIHTNSGGNDT